MNTRIIIYLLLLFYPFFSKGQNNINDTLYSFILKPKSQANGLDSVFLGTFSMTACKGEQTNYLFPPTMINNGQMIYNIYDKLMYSATFGKFDNTVYILRYDMAKKTIVDTIFSEPSLLTKGVIYQITFDNKGGLFFTRAFGYDLYKLELSTKKAILIGNRGKVGQDYAFKYFKGKFYFAEQSRGIVSADPDDFLNSQKTVISAAVLKNQGANIGAYDLLIPSGYCDSSALYLYSSHPVYGGMYRLDLDNNNIIKECSLPIGIGGIERSMNGFFTKKEVLAADCKLTIDLDLDDSTGKPKISYKSTNCMTKNISIADKDLHVNFDRKIDSIVLRFEAGRLNGKEEQLVVSATNSLIGVRLTDKGLTLINKGIAKSINFVSALSEIRYENNSQSIISGERIITVIAYGAGERSDTARAYIELLGEAKAGSDVTVSLCEGQSLNLKTKLSSDADALTGKFYPTLPLGGIFNTTKHSPGVYQYVVSVKGCNNDTSLVEVRVLPKPTPQIIGDSLLCAGQSTFLMTGNFTSYLWDDGQITKSITVSKSGVYSVTVTNNNGCSASTSRTVILNSLLTLDLGQDKKINLGESVTIEALTNITSIKNIVWEPNINANGLKMIVSPANTTTYKLSLTDIFGCSVMDAVSIKVETQENIFIPSIFAPGSEQLENQEFKIYHNNSISKILKMAIYDRWGTLIYEVKNVSPNDAIWDGTFRGVNVPSDVFVCEIIAETKSGKHLKKNQDITLIR